MSDEEDQSLGDFFAKKDKGKKTKKSKKKTKSSDSTDTPTEVTTKSQVDEWKDFEEEKEKDYSSLKIQSLQLNEETKEEEPEILEEDNEGVPIEKAEKSTGIWNTPTPGQSSDSRNASVGKVVDGKYIPPSQRPSASVPSQPPTPSAGAYVPPSLRGGAASASSTPGAYVPPSLRRTTMAELSSSSSKRRQGAPPDLSNQAMFPTLGAANQDLGSLKTTSDFEMVRRGAKTNDSRIDDNRPNLNLGNRFDGLRS